MLSVEDALNLSPNSPQYQALQCHMLLEVESMNYFRTLDSPKDSPLTLLKLGRMEYHEARATQFVCYVRLTPKGRQILQAWLEKCLAKEESVCSDVVREAANLLEQMGMAHLVIGIIPDDEYLDRYLDDERVDNFLSQIGLETKPAEELTQMLHEAARMLEERHDA